MSETTEHPDPTPEREPAPTPGTGPSGVPDTPASETDDTEEQKPQREAEEERQSRGDRRFAELTARLSAAERREQQREQELEFYRRQAQQQPSADETPEQRYHRERAQIRTEVEAEILTRTFHEQGAGAYGDWRQRCDDLVKMGADAGFAKLLVDMPGGEGVKVAAALANDPEVVERIANIQTPHGRAVALGKYAATLDDHPAPRASNGAAAPVTRAPAPIRPVQGRAAPTFNEYTASGQDLVERYMKADMDKRLRR